MDALKRLQQTNLIERNELKEIIEQRQSSEPIKQNKLNEIIEQRTVTAYRGYDTTNYSYTSLRMRGKRTRYVTNPHQLNNRS